MHINHIKLDSTNSITDLCRFGAEHCTDKSPYSRGGGVLAHRHAYTAAYDMLFSTKRYAPFQIGELGILDNSSTNMWRNYFPAATLFGFDVFPDRIAQAKAQNIPNAHYFLADVNDPASLHRAFGEARGLFDVLIDDSTHLFDHQILFVEVAVQYVKAGGLVIVEDIFRQWEEKKYRQALEPLASYFGSATFIDCSHNEAFSEGGNEPYFDNDKILVLCRNQNTFLRKHPVATANLQRISEVLLQSQD